MKSLCFLCDNYFSESSTGVSESMTYAGIVYYEEKGVEDLVTFTAAKDLNALLEVMTDITCSTFVFVLYSMLKNIIPKLRLGRMFTFVLTLLINACTLS